MSKVVHSGTVTPSFRHVNKFLGSLLDDPTPTTPLGDDTNLVAQFDGDVVEMPVSHSPIDCPLLNSSVSFQCPCRSPVDEITKYLTKPSSQTSPNS